MNLQYFTESIHPATAHARQAKIMAINSGVLVKSCIPM